MSLRIQIAPGSRCIILTLKGIVYKVPLSQSASKNLRNEYLCNKEAQLDEFWSNYAVPLFSRFKGILGSKLQKNNESFLEEKLLEFIKLRLEWLDNAPTISFIESVNCNNLKRFVFPHIGHMEYNRLDIFMRSHHVKVGSVHGDLHIENIFCNMGAISIIDWGNHHTKFWAMYDVFHLKHCHFLKAKNTSWIDALDELFIAPAEYCTVSEFKASEEDVICYILARSELELLQDIRLNRLNLNRIKKYRSAVQKINRYLNRML